MVRAVLIVGAVALLWEVGAALFVAWYSGVEHESGPRWRFSAALRLAYFAVLLGYLIASR